MTRRIILRQIFISLALAISVFFAFRAIDNRAERARAAEMAQAEQQARAWMRSHPIVTQEAKR